MAGFMDFFDTDQARLGMGLLAAAGPRADGAGFGQRLMEGVGSLDQWKQDKQRAQYLKAQMEEQSAQAEQRRAKAAQEQALLAQDARKRAALPGLFSQGSAGAPAFNVDDALPSFMRTGSAPQPAVAPRRAGIDVQGALSAGYTADEITKLDGLRNIGQDEVARTVKGIGPDGREYEYQVDKYGRKKDEGLAQWKAPVLNDGGGQTNVLDPYNPLKPIGSLPKTMTFSDKNAAATLNLSRERFNMDKKKTEAETANGGYSSKPLPAAALKMQGDSVDAINAAGTINESLTKIEQQISDGKLKFGPVSNLINSGMNASGMSSQESRNFSSFKSSLERMRNESLRLNTGVQTDGDAQRAWNELFQSINDTELVKQRLQEIRSINERGAELQKLKVDSIRGNYNAPPMDFSKLDKPLLNVPSAGPKRIKFDAQGNIVP